VINLRPKYNTHTRDGRRFYLDNISGTSDYSSLPRILAIIQLETDVTAGFLELLDGKPRKAEQHRNRAVSFLQGMQRTAEKQDHTLYAKLISKTIELIRPESIECAEC